jgi:hypothetical protein
MDRRLERSTETHHHPPTARDGATRPTCFVLVDAYCLSRKNLVPGASGSVTLLPETPGTALHVPPPSRSVLSRMKPVAALGQESVTLEPERLIFKLTDELPML